MRIPVFALFFTLLSGCVVVPVGDERAVDRCELVTKTLTLDIQPVDQVVDADFIGRMVGETIRGCDKPECVLVVIGGTFVTIAGTSAIISGSIVAVGNTVHWMEEQGRCSESEVRRAISLLTRAAKDAGGFVITSSEQMAGWFIRQGKRLFPTD